MLERDGSVTMHQRNLRFLALELYKSKTGVSPTLVDAIFEKKNISGINLRSQTDFEIPNIVSS